MKELIKQIRLALLIPLMWLVLKMTPKECKDTLRWIANMPLEK